LGVPDDTPALFRVMALAAPTPTFLISSGTEEVVWWNAVAETGGFVPTASRAPTLHALPMSSASRRRLLSLRPGQSWSHVSEDSEFQGRLRTVRWAATAMEVGRCTYIVLQLADLTRERLRLRTLEDDERTLREYSAANYDANYDWTVEGDHLAFSEQMDTLLGSDPGGSPTTWSEWTTLIHPDDCDVVIEHDQERASRPYTPRGSIGYSFYEEYRIRRADGSYALVSDRGFVVDGPGYGQRHVVGLVHDVTAEMEARRAREESARLYATLFTAAVNPVFHLSADGVCLAANSAAEALFGVGREELVGHQASEYFPQTLIDELPHHLAPRTVDDGPSVVECTLTLGSEAKHVLVSMVPCDAGEAPTWFLMCTDITPLKKVTDSLMRSERILHEQANALRDRETALRVILEQRDADRRDGERTMASNLDMLASPILDRLEHSLRNRPEAAHVSALRQTLAELTQPLRERLGVEPLSLTARELEIANLIKAGLTSQQIADALYISSSTVAFHRANIRRKTGWCGPGTRLSRHVVVAATLRTPVPSDTVHSARETIA